MRSGITSNFAKRFRLTALRRNKQVISVYIYRSENPHNKDSLTANFLQVLPALDIKSNKIMTKLCLSFQKWLSLLILICKTSRWNPAGGLKGMTVLKCYEAICDSKKSNNALESKFKVR